MRVITTRPLSAGPAGAATSATARESLLNARATRWLRYAIRLGVGLLVGAVLGPPIQKGLALVSLRFLVPAALATVALALVALAIERTVRDLGRARGVVRQD